MGLIRPLLLRMGGVSEMSYAEFLGGPKLGNDSSVNVAVGGGGALLVISFSHLISVAVLGRGLSEARTYQRKIGERVRIAFVGPGAWHQRDRLYPCEQRELLPFLPQLTKTLDPSVVIVFILTTLNLPNK